MPPWPSNRSDTFTVGNSISGTGSLTQRGSGTLVVSGTNTYTGSTNFSGGNLQVASAESAGVSGPLGVGGTLSFTGGTLQYSGSNVTDYSSRFSAAAGQAYSIDTNGQTVTYASGLNSSGGSLTKTGSGSLGMLTSNSYSGGTSVTAGTLDIVGTLANTSAVAVDATNAPASLVLDGINAVSSSAPLTASA